ncbi:hypothetical protein Tco_1154650 [Tanacetum coccineum]
MENSKRGSIPMQEKLRLSKSQGASTPAELKRMQNVPYASAVGSIMYDVRCTRPDVAFAQNITSQFQQNLECHAQNVPYASAVGSIMYDVRCTCPDVAFAQNITSQFQQNLGDLHWTTVKNILKYLRNTKDMFLVYGGDLKRELRVSCYTDAWISDGAVDWKSAKQSIFATSSAEAEYIVAFDASKEAVWVRKFISGLSVVPIIEKPINMYYDNTRAIAIANESRITKRCRHFRLPMVASPTGYSIGLLVPKGVDNRRITLIVIRARANSAVVVSLLDNRIEFIKSSVKSPCLLVPIPSESKGVPKVCDVPVHDNSPPLDQSEDFSDSNVDSTSTDEDSFSSNEVEYVEASPPNSEPVSSKGRLEMVYSRRLEVMRMTFIYQRQRKDTLREKIVESQSLVAKIEA